MSINFLEKISSFNTEEMIKDYDSYFFKYKNISTDFYNKPSIEHYRLLAYFSSVYNNEIIIDIGTHHGESALALSYNNTNKIYSFDIMDKVSEDKKVINNIQFILGDLFYDKNFRDQWKDTILKSKFIFLDVDSHGNMEYLFYLFLKENNYNGFMICDDIWYFKEMRDNFWYKIDHSERYDITHLGHWSGTGIISFNPKIIFPKNNNDNWTLVTAYFNLTKCPDASLDINKRDQTYYLSHSISTLNLPYNLVIYCDEDSLDKLKNIRPKYLQSKTIYIVRNFDDFMFSEEVLYKYPEFKNLDFRKYREIINKNRKNNPYNFDNRNTASYYLFCMSRYVILREVIKTNPFNSTHISWINLCIERMGFKNLIHLDEALSVNRDKFSTCYINYIPKELINNPSEYYKWGRCSMCSGFFTGNTHYMDKVCELIQDKFIYYLKAGYGHADEQLYSPVYFENPDLFEHYYGDYQQMITNYVYVYDSPNCIVYNFIKNSFNNKNYEKCLEGCKFLWKSICLDKCILDENYTQYLYFYYMSCKKILKYFD